MDRIMVRIMDRMMSPYFAALNPTLLAHYDVAFAARGAKIAAAAAIVAGLNKVKPEPGAPGGARPHKVRRCRLTSG